VAAMFGNSTGNDNVALGYVSLFHNTTGAKNTAVGYRVLQENETADGNTGVGAEALLTNRSGSGNTAVGANALRTNTASNNTALGQDGLRNATVGFSNTAVGSEALRDTTEGDYNVAVGTKALLENTTGNRNTAVGGYALDSTSGTENIALGYRAGQNVTTGSFNILIGHDGFAAESKKIRIGDSTHDETFIAAIHGNTINGSTVQVLSTGELGVAAPSSRRFKRDIGDVDGALEPLLQLRPVRFRYRPELVEGGGGIEYGLIAEEVARVMPELVRWDEAGRPFGVRYELLTPLLLASLQRQEAIVRDLRAKLERLEQRGRGRSTGR
jgi:hypothetical protein